MDVVGSVSSILTLVEYSMKVGNWMLKTLKEDLNEYDYCERTAKDLGDTAIVLESNLKAKDLTQGCDSNDEAIRKIAQDCHDVMSGLTRMMESVKPSKPDKGRASVSKAVEHFAKAIKKSWKEDEIAQMMKTLDRCRDQLILRLIMRLDIKSNFSIDQNIETQHRLSDITDIVEVTAILQKRQENTSVEQTDKILNRLGERGDRLEITSVEQTDKILNRLGERHDRLEGIMTQIVTATMKRADGTTMNLTPQAQETLAPLDSRSERTAIHWAFPQPSTSSVFETTHYTGADMNRVERLVLKCLSFRQLSDRYETVKDAHTTTYKWVFCKPEAAKRPWDDFAQWLQHGSGCYWICGKAGSGKSTLMKYIHQHKHTADLLSTWAPNGLRKACFFFYGYGHDLQKTQNGLLRSLLYDVLSSNRHLISAVMTDLVAEAADLAPGRSLDEPSLAELLRWFKKMVTTSSDQRYFFLVDGLDEYDGDITTIIDFVDSMAELPNAKFLISSRPLPGCVEKFSRFPHLQLHDLTRQDIRQYAQHRLDSKLRRYDPSWADIIEQITYKSSGVFLWVEIVIRSLLQGLENRDNLQELQSRLEELPSDLADLYAHMFNKMPPSYRKQAAHLFQLVLERRNVYPDFPLTTLQLSFAEADPSDIFKAARGTLTHDEEKRRCEYVEGRLRSRCCGLIETRPALGETEALTTMALHHQERPCVDFIHRTAVEFLQTDAIVEKTAQWCDTGFMALKSLFYSCLHMCKRIAIEKLINSTYWEYPVEYPVYRLVRVAMSCLSMIERSGHSIDIDYLYDLEITMKQCAQQLPRKVRKNTKSSEGSNLLILLHECQDPRELRLWGGFNEEQFLIYWDSDEHPSDLFSLIIVYGLTQTCDQALKAKPSLLVQDEHSKALHLHFSVFSILCSARPTRLELPPQWLTARQPELFKICETLVRAKANPNLLIEDREYLNYEKFGYGSFWYWQSQNFSAWTLILQHLALVWDENFAPSIFFENGGYYAHQLGQLVKVLIEGGADVNAVVSVDYGYKRSALSIFQAFIGPNGMIVGGWSTMKFHDIYERSSVMERTLEELYLEILQMLRERGAVETFWKPRDDGEDVTESFDNESGRPEPEMPSSGVPISEGLQLEVSKSEGSRSDVLSPSGSRSEHPTSDETLTPEATKPEQPRSEAAKSEEPGPGAHQSGQPKSEVAESGATTPGLPETEAKETEAPETKAPRLTHEAMTASTQLEEPPRGARSLGVSLSRGGLAYPTLPYPTHPAYGLIY